MKTEKYQPHLNLRQNRAFYCQFETTIDMIRKKGDENKGILYENVEPINILWNNCFVLCVL